VVVVSIATLYFKKAFLAMQSQTAASKKVLKKKIIFFYLYFLAAKRKARNAKQQLFMCQQKAAWAWLRNQATIRIRRDRFFFA
jgi:hypothetical protein